MNKENRFTVIPKASIRPDKIVFYNQYYLNEVSDPLAKKPMDKFDKKKAFISLINGVETKKSNTHNFEISKKAGARIKEKINWLYNLAKNRTIETHNGKVLNSFRMNFITLTMPSIQIHATAEITDKCLNQFLTECKARFGLKNFVWRLEFQKNGNAHYHIATDTYIDFLAAKTIWNRCLNKLGYVDRYSEKMRKYNLAQYCAEFGADGKTEFNVLRERFGRGCATRWVEPNTVDIRAVTNSKNISFYISKYITKKSDHTLNPIVSCREPTTSNLRLWFCSRSLSKLSKIEIFMDSYSDLVYNCLSSLENCKNFIFDYCSVKYFNLKEQSKAGQVLWRKLFWDYAKEHNYSTG